MKLRRELLTKMLNSLVSLEKNKALDSNDLQLPSDIPCMSLPLNYNEDDTMAGFYRCIVLTVIITYSY